MLHLSRFKLGLYKTEQFLPDYAFHNLYIVILFMVVMLLIIYMKK